MPPAAKKVTIALPLIVKLFISVIALSPLGPIVEVPLLNEILLAAPVVSKEGKVSAGAAVPLVVQSTLLQVL